MSIAQIVRKFLHGKVGEEGSAPLVTAIRVFTPTRVMACATARSVYSRTCSRAGAHMLTFAHSLDSRCRFALPTSLFSGYGLLLDAPDDGADLHCLPFSPACRADAPGIERGGDAA